MEDCIHLHACRRMCLITKFHGSRGCNEQCTAYESVSKYYTEDQVERVKNGACRDGRNGYDCYDLLISDYV